MSRPLQLALAAILVAFAAGQIALSVSTAVQLPPPPPPYSESVAGTSHSWVSPSPTPVGRTPFSSPDVVAPDPANILRITIEEEGLSPSRMQAKSRSRLFLMVRNRGAACSGVVISDGQGREVARVKALATNVEETIEVSLEAGEFTVSVPSTTKRARLTSQ